ncbi:hypothetical protein DENIS_3046 [Desulfonema ishimotonii]|uniref:Uncharacterized protein n=1 Tax=Desulfonema ishimotonii TaxID=45657 RepID=A0A401FYR0_9BACT|nr:hypothetical protein DENIS_3046 [Desulfonema ishimotonii]
MKKYVVKLENCHIFAGKRDVFWIHSGHALQNAFFNKYTNMLDRKIREKKRPVACERNGGDV